MNTVKIEENAEPSVLDDNLAYSLHRSDITEVLSTSVNGCLSELGYFPGIVQEFNKYKAMVDQLRMHNQRLHNENEEVRNENRKLFEDNTNMVTWITQNSQKEIEMLRAECNRLREHARISAEQAAHASSQVAQFGRPAHQQSQGQGRRASQPIPGMYVSAHPQQGHHMTVMQVPMPQPQGHMLPAQISMQPQMSRSRQASLPMPPGMGYHHDVSRSSTSSSAYHTPTSGATTPHRSAQNSPSVTSAPATTPMHSPTTHIPVAMQVPHGYASHFRPLASAPSSFLDQKPPPSPSQSSVIDLTGMDDESPAEETAWKKRRLAIDTSGSFHSARANADHSQRPASSSSSAMPAPSATPTHSNYPPPLSDFGAAKYTSGTPIHYAPQLGATVEAPPVSAPPTSEPIATAAAPIPTPSSEPMSADPAVSETQEHADPPMEVSEPAEADEEDDEDTEEAPELDEDGRVSVRYCLDQAFDDDAGDVSLVWCLMCKKRYGWSKAQNIPCPVPVPFKRDETKAMEEHCQKEHPIGWGILRQSTGKPEAGTTA